MDRKQVNRHDWSGNCMPGKDFVSSSTFSVGVFQWVPMSKSWSCARLKKSKVIHRVKGKTANPEAVYAKAGEICDALDIGYEMHTKRTTVK